MKRCKYCGETILGTTHSCTNTGQLYSGDMIESIGLILAVDELLDSAFTGTESSFDPSTSDTSSSSEDFGGFGGGDTGGGGTSGEW